MTMTAPRPVRGIIPRAQKGVIYGPPGVGKTTFGAQFPGAVFLDAENGTTHLDVLRYPVDSWAAIPSIIRDLARDPGEVQTLVIDSADWVERLLIEDVSLKKATDGNFYEFFEKRDKKDRNEPLDVRVYNIAAARKLRINFAAVAKNYADYAAKNPADRGKEREYRLDFVKD